MIKILGLDVSTFVGCTMTGRGETKTKVIHFKEHSGFKRLQLIAQGIANLLEEWQPDMVVIEGYALGSRNNLQLMVEVGTVVRQALYAKKLSWWEVPPSTLKKWVTGKGGAKKPDMAKAVLERWGFESKSDDIVDGYCLSMLGKAIKEQGIQLKGVNHVNSTS